MDPDPESSTVASFSFEKTSMDIALTEVLRLPVFFTSFKLQLTVKI
jgi:hypothetical protein